MTAVAPKFLNTLTLFQSGGQILPATAKLTTKISLWIHPCDGAATSILSPLSLQGLMTLKADTVRPRDTRPQAALDLDNALFLIGSKKIRDA